MSCTGWENSIDDYVDGRLSADERVNFDRHLGSCASCRVAVSELSSLVAAASSLPRGLQPSRDLLPAVRRFAGQKSSSSPRYWSRWSAAAAIAASVIVVFGAGFLVSQLLGTSDTRGVAGGIESVGGGDEPVFLTGPYLIADREYSRAADDLSSLLDAKRGSLSPETIRVIDENLAIIDRAIRDARAALEADPGNISSGRSLTTLHQQKLQLLRKAGRLSA